MGGWQKDWSKLSQDELARLKKRALDDFWFFARDVLSNYAYDPYFHGLLAQVAMHGVTRMLPPGDYYLPTRADLVKVEGQFGKAMEKYRLTYRDKRKNKTVPSNSGVCSMTARLGLEPTVMDGSFRGYFIRIVPPSLSELTQCLVPRAHLKTTFLTSARHVWLIARNPELVALITMNSGENAKNVISEIKGFFERCDRFRLLFPELIHEHMRDEGSSHTRRKVEGIRWQAMKFDVPRQEATREATVTGVGIGGRTTSLHADYLHFDDLVDEKTVATDDGVLKNIIRFQQMLHLGKGDVTKMFYVGTPWHYSDLSQWLLDSGESGYLHTNVVIATIEDKNGDPLYPKQGKTNRGSHPGFTRAKIRSLRNKTEKSGQYSSQYLMQPVAAGDQSFKPEWWRYYLKVPSGNLTTVMTVDPAISQRHQGDYSAFVVTSLDANGNWFVRECVRHRMLGTEGIIDTIYALWEAYKTSDTPIEMIGVEAVGFQRTIHYILRDKAITDGRELLPVVEVQPSKRESKEFRIKRIVPKLRDGQILVPVGDKGAPWDWTNQRHVLHEPIAALIKEGERFPLGKHDDLLDALAMTIDLPVYPDHIEVKPTDTLVQRMRKKFRERNGRPDCDPVLGGVW